MTGIRTTLPPVTAEAAAAALDELPARLRRRVDAAVTKLGGRPVEEAGQGRLRVRVDDDTAVVLVLGPAGVVTRAADVSCSCLLAPACLHRAAVLAAAPIAEETEAEAEPDAAPDPTTAPPHGGTAAPPTLPGAAHGPTDPGTPAGAVPQAPPTAAAAATGSGPSDTASGPPVPGARSGPGTGEPAPGVRSAAQELWTAGAALLGSGLTTAALPRTRLLHAAHTARLAGLYRPSAAAVRVARRLGEAGAADPAFRLGELTGDLAELLDAARTLLHAGGADEVAAVAGTARRPYRVVRPLRLYGLFTESVVTASGYAGATTYAVTADGARHTVADIAPGGPERAVRAAGSPVPGGAAMSLRELGSGGGLILSEATVSSEGRIGGGGRVRSVRAAGAGWYEPPVAGLWERPVAEQVRAALDWLAEPADSRPVGGDLLFLDGTLARVGGAPALAVNGGPLVPLHAPDERAELPYAGNLRLLAGRPGLAVRLIGRPAPDRPGGLSVLALSRASDGDGVPVRYDLGLQRLTAGSLPRPTAGRTSDAAAPSGVLPVELELLSRAVARAVAGGRTVTAVACDPGLPARLRAVGLGTASECARVLAAAAADRRPDALGRLLHADADAFAAAWLAAAVYTAAASRALLADAWGAG